VSFIPILSREGEKIFQKGCSIKKETLTAEAVFCKRKAKGEDHEEKMWIRIDK
jgi:hypothetical protein